MTRAEVLREQFAILREVESIGGALATIERQHGPHALIDDARRRQQQLHDDALRQLALLLDGGTLH